MLKSTLLILALITTFGVPKELRRITPSGPKDVNLSGFFVDVDMTYNKWASSDSSSDSDQDETIVPMMLALYSSSSLFTQDCLGYSKYSCKDYPFCKESGDKTNVAFPYFTSQGQSVSTEAYLSYDKWSLASNATLVTSCQSNADRLYGSGAYGLIGMGFKDDNKKNFIKSSFFSIYLDEDRNGGKLLFKSDMGYAQAENPVVTLKSNQDFHVSKVNGIKIGDYNYHVDDGKLIFDLNSDAIGLPLELYKHVMKVLNTEYSISCSEVVYNVPKCTYNGLISDIPTIYIGVKNKMIPIVPEIYVQNFNDYSDDDNGSHRILTLNFRALSNDLTGSSYVTKEYSNYIILDSHIMSYYYTVFDTEIGSVSLYIADHSSDSEALYIVIGSGILLVILATCCYGIIRKSKKSPKTSPSTEVSEDQERYQSVDQTTLSRQNQPHPSMTYQFGPNASHQYIPQPQSYPNSYNNTGSYSNYQRFDSQPSHYYQQR